MKTAVKLIAGLVLSISCLQAFADAPDPLWKKAVQHLQQAQKYAARDIEQKLEVDKDGTKKQVTMKLQQSSWKEQAPVYTIMSAEPAPKDGKLPKAIDFEPMMKGVSRLMCDEQTPVTRINGQKRDGLDLTVFEFSEGGIQKVNAKIWVYPETGEIYSYQIHVAVPLAAEFDMKVRFDDTPQKIRLGVARETTFQSKVPFNKAEGHLFETLSNWVARP